MASLGLNVPRDGSMGAAAIRALGATWVRIVALAGLDLTTLLQSYRANGLRVLLVLARESGGDYATYARRYGTLVDAIEVGNEPDLTSPSSWTMSTVELSSLGRAVRGVFPTMPLVVGGLASGHPEWLDGMDLSPFDAIAFHPYLRDAPNPSDLEDLPDVDALARGYQRFGKPLLITEWGWWSDQEPRASEEVADMVTWAGRTDLVKVFFYFCSSDAMVPPFGLLDAAGREKPRAKPFRERAPLAVHSLWPPITAPAPPPVPPAKPDPWQWFSADQIAAASECPVAAIADNWPRLVEQLGLCGINDRATQIAMIGTVAIESASTFAPVREAFWLSEDWRRTNLRYYPWYGRGFIQLTWRENYAALSQKVNDLWQAGGAIDLIARPDDALDPDVSAAVAALYFRDHGGDGAALIPHAAAAGNWAEVRRLVQGGNAGLDRLTAIASALLVAPPPPPPPAPPNPSDTIRAQLAAIRAACDAAEAALT